VMVGGGDGGAWGQGERGVDGKKSG